MAKEKAKPKTETPFERFQRLAKRIVSVPKDKARPGKPRSPSNS